ncbi:hypothetical protein MHB65_12975 [Lysinibacillus sp. FSL K6-0075]|uniref:hypothetical protein n=1 Tax=Lysinibacillus sp. FSL K6-0075 TaxID=2921415 RepID=UPI0031595F6D
MELFDDKLIQHTIKAIQSPYQFNMYEKNPFTINAVISNATFSPNSTFHIHSLDVFNCGDYTTINNPNNVYMVTSDVLTMRGGKYKATLEYCNYLIVEWKTEKVLIGKDALGRPVYEEQQVKVGEIPCILRYKDMTYTTNDSINLTKPIYQIIVRDTDASRKNFKLNENPYGDVTIYDTTYRIIDVDYSKKGIINIRLEKR